MAPFDDSIAQERQAFSQKLRSLLRHAAPPAASASTEKRAQILAYVRERLQQRDDEELATLAQEDLPVQEKEPGKVPQTPPFGKKTAQRTSRVKRAIELVAAVLVVGILISGSLLLFTTLHQANGNISMRGPDGSVVVRSQAGGVEVSLQVTPGPYFLSELLATDVTLTNHNKTPLLLEGTINVNYCTAAFGTAANGGGKPYYKLPSETVMSCPPANTKLEAGQIVTVHGYVPLVASGEVAITTGVRILTLGKDGVLRNSANPLDGHWPTLHIHVAPKIPTDRILSFHKQGSQITIDGPAFARAHLVEYGSGSCTEGEGSESTTNGGWTMLKSATLQALPCSGTNRYWSYAIGAAGYAIISGETAY